MLMKGNSTWYVCDAMKWGGKTTMISFSGVEKWHIPGDIYCNFGQENKIDT